MDRRKAIKGLGLSLGYVVSAPTALRVLEACSEKKESWESLFFNESEKQVVPYLVDIILPATDTPGGLELNLPQFIDMMCEDTLNEADKVLVHGGSEVLERRFEEKFGKGLIKAKKQEVSEIFSLYFDLEAEQERKVKFMQDQPEENLSGADLEDYKLYKFLMAVRSLALLGYFTSEKIGTEVLNFDPIPGGFQPCIPVSEVGNAWTI